MEFKVAEKLENLVKDGRLEKDGEGWSFSGNASVFKGFSRNQTADSCIRFTGSGSAEYRLDKVPEGEYSLRYFLYDRGPIKRADMTVTVSGGVKANFHLTPRGWWSEYASDSIFVPKDSLVVIRMDVEDNADNSVSADNTWSYELSGTEDMKSNTDICVDLDEIQFIKIPYTIPEPKRTENYVSCLAKRDDGTYYMEVDGKPFLSRHAHAFDLHVHDMRERVKKLKEAGFNTFSSGMDWNRTQTEPDQSDLDDIDFSKVDEAIEIAEELDMYVSFGFSGAGNCGILKSAPEYIRNDHSLHAKDPITGQCHQKSNAKDGSDRMCLADYGNPRLMELEGNVVKRIIDYINERDKNNKIVMFKLENEPLESIYACTDMHQEDVARHIDYLAAIIKNSKKSMMVYANHGFGSAAHFVYNTPHIDFNGTDPYTNSMSAINKILLDPFNSRIACIAENGGYDNSAAQFAAAYARDGFVSPYPIGPDTYWDRPGLYGYDFDKDEFIVLELTKKITSINLSCAKISEVLVKQPYSHKSSFNTEDSGMQKGYCGTKLLGEVKVTMDSAKDKAIAGLAVADGNAIYCAADDDCTFTLDRPILSAESGEYKNGRWVCEKSLPLKDNKVEYPQNSAVKLIW
ncbi:MAG TPA: cellulase family glycosylhydrolase [Bacillota bacterium]|nr:cellulase family glycosylhydrolase [Bacillota bacterium]